MEILAKNLLVLASAGSGKTFQLGNRILALIGRGTPPERIAALTFTRKAAGEFADSVLSKLASAAADPSAADRLRADIQLPDADVGAMLETTVRGLPELTFSTMDGFFAAVVRGFQYELGLTGGSFELVEGPRARLLADALIASILGSAIRGEQGDEFLHAFRRATIGREEQGVLEPLRRSVETWHEIFRSRQDPRWEEPPFETDDPKEWENLKHSLAAEALGHLGSIEYTRKGQPEALEAAIRKISDHTIGSGSLNGATSLLQSLLESDSSEEGNLILRYYKEFTVSGGAAASLRRLVGLAARCEAGAALRRTRAIREVVTHYDQRKELVHRRAGRLGFDDVKFLMGQWATDEQARLRREIVDFRIDSRTDHWLLDEFQDTSRADWAALRPLLEEAITREDATAFIVGDRKQAIYAWRGGDVGLFDEIIRDYGPGFTIEPMFESWRSSPEVLSLVNRICGDGATLVDQFGPVGEFWIQNWQDHVSAPPLRDPERAGEARVEWIGDREARFQRLVEILRENEVGGRSLTCGVLLRSNNLVRDVADLLRNEGFDVIEEGTRQPSRDSQSGVLVHNLLRWLANPSDSEAFETLRMAPLPQCMETDEQPDHAVLWEILTRKVSQRGFSATVDELFSGIVPSLHEFGRGRFDEILAQLDLLDAMGCTSPREAADWLEHLEISQSPGVGAVQVMTIHKSKGLGFDLVVLPDIPTDGIPKANRFEVAIGEGWITQSPPLWARRQVPELAAAEDEWAQRQRYEALCGLYVALTRARFGLHVLLDNPPRSERTNSCSLGSWLLQSTGCSAETPVLQIGADGWSRTLPCLRSREDLTTPEPPTRQFHVKPFELKASQRLPISPEAAAYGTAVHQTLDSIDWLDETPSSGGADGKHDELPDMVKAIFLRNGRQIRLLKEQPLLARTNGRSELLVSDRIHLHLDPDDEVDRIEIIDFKTDHVQRMDQLIERHSAQLESYAEILHRIYPSATIDRLLVSTRLGEVARF